MHETLCRECIYQTRCVFKTKVNFIHNLTIFPDFSELRAEILTIVYVFITYILFVLFIKGNLWYRLFHLTSQLIILMSPSRLHWQLFPFYTCHTVSQWNDVSQTPTIPHGRKFGSLFFQEVVPLSWIFPIAYCCHLDIKQHAPTTIVWLSVNVE